jgi:hypothetical protein
MTANKFYIVKEGKVLTNHGMKNFWFTNNENFAYPIDSEIEANKIASQYEADVVEGFSNLAKYILENE